MTPLAQPMSPVEPATETRIASYLLTEYLERLGVEVIFGLCGHTNIAFLDALSKSRIRFISTRHEQVAAHMADLIIERLVPALKGASEEHHWRALDAISQALEIACIEAGSPADERREIQDNLRRVVMIARGMSLETRPGRKLPWWRRHK